MQCVNCKGRILEDVGKCENCGAQVLPWDAEIAERAMSAGLPENETSPPTRALTEQERTRIWNICWYVVYALVGIWMLYGLFFGFSGGGSSDCIPDPVTGHCS